MCQKPMAPHANALSIRGLGPGPRISSHDCDYDTNEDVGKTQHQWVANPRSQILARNYVPLN